MTTYRIWQPGGLTRDRSCETNWFHRAALYQQLELAAPLSGTTAGLETNCFVVPEQYSSPEFPAAGNPEAPVETNCFVVPEQYSSPEFPELIWEGVKLIILYRFPDSGPAAGGLNKQVKLITSTIQA